MRTMLRWPSVTLVLAAFLYVSFSGCEKIQRPATGQDAEIYVFADSLDWEKLRDPLREALEIEILTPQPEKIFRLIYYPFHDFHRLRHSKNLIIAGSVHGEGDVSQYIRTALSHEVKQIVEEDREFLINKYDAHARGQIMMFLASTDVPTLVMKIREHKDEIFYFFENAWMKREISSLYADVKYAKKDIEKKIFDQYAWKIFVQHDYWVAVDSAAERFVWLRRVTPADMERWIFVHWIESADPRMLSPSLPIFLRNLVTKSFYKTVEDTIYVRIADDPVSAGALHIEETNFLGRFGYEMRGLWQFSDMSGGGPFINYTFYDEGTQRIYMIDGSVFAPRYEKKKLLMQVRAIAHTFRTAADLSESELKALKD